MAPLMIALLIECNFFAVYTEPVDICNNAGDIVTLDGSETAVEVSCVSCKGEASGLYVFSRLTGSIAESLYESCGPIGLNDVDVTVYVCHKGMALLN